MKCHTRNATSPCCSRDERHPAAAVCTFRGALLFRGVVRVHTRLSRNQRMRTCVCLCKHERKNASSLPHSLCNSLWSGAGPEFDRKERTHGTQQDSGVLHASDAAFYRLTPPVQLLCVRDCIVVETPSPVCSTHIDTRFPRKHLFAGLAAVLPLPRSTRAAASARCRVFHGAIPVSISAVGGSLVAPLTFVRLPTMWSPTCARSVQHSNHNSIA